MNDFIEQRIIDAVRRLLSGRVIELLHDMQFSIPLLEFGDYCDNSVIVPVITLASSERTEKERIILLDAYSLTITFNIPETPESELYCYAYAAVVEKAITEDKSLGGIADRIVLTGKKYNPPKKPHCGDGWEVVITIRIIVERGL